MVSTSECAFGKDLLMRNRIARVCVCYTGASRSFFFGQSELIWQSPGWEQGGNWNGGWGGGGGGKGQHLGRWCWKGSCWRYHHVDGLIRAPYRYEAWKDFSIQMATSFFGSRAVQSNWRQQTGLRKSLWTIRSIAKEHLVLKFTAFMPTNGWWQHHEGTPDWLIPKHGFPSFPEVEMAKEKVKRRKSRQTKIGTLSLDLLYLLTYFSSKLLSAWLTCWILFFYRPL